MPKLYPAHPEPRDLELELDAMWERLDRLEKLESSLRSSRFQASSTGSTAEVAVKRAGGGGPRVVFFASPTPVTVP